MRTTHSIRGHADANAGGGLRRRPVGGPADHLHLARIRSGIWTSPVPARGEQGCAFIAMYAIRGSATITYRDRHSDVAAGDFVMLRSSRSFDIRAMPEADLLLIRIPEDVVGPYRHALRAADGRAIPTSTGTASIVAHLLNGLAEQVDDYAPQNPGRLAQHIVGLMALMCVDGQVSAVTSRDSMLYRAQEYIEDNLGDLNLTPDRIAASQNMSTRTLHRLFESEGLTISGWIRSRRLENCRQELSDVTLEVHPVSSIGAKWGLWDAAHFSRLFKAAYGLSPRAYRAGHLGHRCDNGCAGQVNELRLESA